MDFNERIKHIREHFKQNQREFSEILGINKSLVSVLEKDREPSRQVLLKLAEKFNIDLNWLLTGTGSMFKSDEIIQKIKLPILDIKASAGYGIINYDQPNIIDYFDVEKHVLGGASPVNCHFLIVDGDSMAPTFNTGDIVACSVGEIKGDGFYIINNDGNLRVKRLQFKLDGTIIVISDNPNYEKEIIKPSNDSQILNGVVGRIFFHGKRY